MSKPFIFLSHVHTDEDYANTYKIWLENSFIGAIDVFVSSCPESLPPGSDWTKELRKSLDGAVVTLVLSSRTSVNSNWLYFEAGSAYIKGIPIVPICVAGLSISDLPPPLSLFQALDSRDPKANASLLNLISRILTLHCPKTESALALPDRLDILSPETKSDMDEQAGAKERDFLIKRLYKKDAEFLLEDMDPRKRKRIEDIVFACTLNDHYSSTEPWWKILAHIKCSLMGTSLVSESDFKSIFEEAENAAQTYSPPPKKREWEDHYKSQKLIEILSHRFPSYYELQSELLQYPDQELVPCLVVSYFSGNLLKRQQLYIVDLILNNDYGAAILGILEDEILRLLTISGSWGTRGSREWKIFNKIRHMLHGDFDYWYKDFRGISYSDDIRAFKS